MERFLEMLSTSKKELIRLGAIAFWLLVWLIASLLIGEELFLPSPIKVIQTFVHLLSEKLFWSSILFSLERVAIGFILSLVMALFFALLSYRYKWFELLIEPMIKTIKATPVASIVILILVWISSRNLSVIISMLIVLPVIYTNVLEGLRATDKSLLEMADVYRIKMLKRARHIYLPSVAPYYLSGMKIALGLSWKSAIAAEVIGMPDGSIGERLYEAKVYLSTPDLFAWTLVIIVLAIVFERIMLRLSEFIIERVAR